MAIITNSICTTNQEIDIQSGTGTLNINTLSASGTINIGNGVNNTGNQTISIGQYGAAGHSKNVTIGSMQSAGDGTTTINAGSGGIVLATINNGYIRIVSSGTGDVEIDSQASELAIGKYNTTGNISIGSSSSAILALAAGSASTITITNASLGVQTGTGALNLNTVATANVTTIGNVSGASAVNINTGTAGHTVTTTNGIITMVSGAGIISISNDAAATTVNVATGAGVKALTLGSTNTSSSVTINTGSGGFKIPSFTNYGALVSNTSGLITDAAATAGYVLTGNSGSAPSFQAPSAGGITWVNVTSATQAMAINTAYVSNDTSTLVTLTLPATAAIGSIVQVQGAGSGLYTIAQNASQLINFNSVVSTTGTGGSVSSTSQFDSITLVCITANTTWAVNQSVGTFSVV